MLFYENGKKVRYNPYNMKRDLSCGEGMETEAYVVKDKVVKFYKRYCKKIRMDKKTCEALSNIDTNRILMPESALLDKKRNIKGYTMEYISDLGEDSFFNLSKERLKEEIEELEKDVIELSNNGVELEDILTKSNTVFHMGVYLIDPGSYLITAKTDKERLGVYNKNIGHINEYLIKIITRRAYKYCQDRNRLRDFRDALKREIYSNNIDPITYLKNIKTDTLDKLIRIKLEDSRFKCLLNGQELDMNSYKKLYSDVKKEIYCNREQNKILYLYKTRNNKLKLTKDELKQIKTISTKRIIIPRDYVEVSKNNYKAYQINGIPNCGFKVDDLDGKSLSKELELLKEDALSLAREGIYVGEISEDDVLCTDKRLYVKNIEGLEYFKSDDLEKKNINSLNKLLTSLITDKLYTSTSLRNTCFVLNSIKKDGGYIGNTINEELKSSENLSDCVKKMVKTRGEK